MSEILDTAREVLRLEGAELLRHADLIGEEIERAASLILACKGKVIVTGVGKSGHIGVKIAATLASTGTPSFFVHPTEALHGDLGMIGKDDMVLAISFSGESEELVRILPHLKRFGVKIIAMARDKNSSLGKVSDEFISLNIVKEACPLGAAPTVSTTLTLALGDALAICLMRQRRFGKEDFANFHPGGSLGKRLFVKVKDVMQSKNLPVASRNAALEAILSDGDLRRALMREDFDINDGALKYATKNPKMLDDKNMLAIDALNLIEQFKIQVLPVVENGVPAGILHIHDLTSLGLK